MREIVIRLCPTIGPASGIIPEHRIDELQRQDDARMAVLNEHCRREIEKSRGWKRKMMGGISARELRQKQEAARAKRYDDDKARKRAAKEAQP